MSSYHGWTHAPKEQGGTDPIPSLANAAATLPYPSRYMRRAISGMLTEARFWPGGWVVAPVYPWAVDGTVDDGFLFSAWAKSGVRHDQSAANYAAADVTALVRPVDDLGVSPLIPYQLQVGYRVTDTGTNIGVRTGPKPNAGDPNGAGSSSESGYPHHVFATGVPHDYFGIFRMEYSTVSAGHGDARYWSAGEELEIKAYRTAGSGEVILDQLYFIPVGVATTPEGAPGSANDLIARSVFVGQASHVGPTGDFIGSVAGDNDRYGQGGGAGGNYLRDTQRRYGWQIAGDTGSPVEDKPTWSGWTLGPSLQPFGGHQAQDDWDTMHPRHLYVLGHGRWPTEHVTTQFSAAGFITIAGDTHIWGQAPVVSDSWAWHYLGWWPGTEVFDQQVALWLAEEWVDGVPWSDTETDITDIEIESMIASSSLYDPLNHVTGGLAYLG